MEIAYDYDTGQTLYFCRFDEDGQVYLSDGSGVETWGASGHDADDYDVAMTEQTTGAGQSGHYVGQFDVSGNITTAGTYRVVVRLQDGVAPADTDDKLAHGSIAWDGSQEITDQTVSSDIAGVSSQVSALTLDVNKVKNVYTVDESTAEGVYPRTEL